MKAPYVLIDRLLCKNPSEFVEFQGMGVNSIQLQEIQTERHREMQSFNERLQLAQMQNTRNSAAAAAAAAKTKQKPPQRAAAIASAAVSAAALKSKARAMSSSSSSSSEDDDAPVSSRSAAVSAHDTAASSALAAAVVSYDDPDEDEDDAPMTSNRNLGAATARDGNGSDSDNSVGTRDVDCPPLKDVQKAQLTRRLIMDALGQTYLQDMVVGCVVRCTGVGDSGACICIVDGISQSERYSFNVDGSSTIEVDFMLEVNQLKRCRRIPLQYISNTLVSDAEVCSWCRDLKKENLQILAQAELRSAYTRLTQNWCETWGGACSS